MKLEEIKNLRNYNTKFFDNPDTDSNDVIITNWKGKTNLAPSQSTVYLQIYNRNSDSWETLDSDDTTGSDTEFSLSGTQSSNLSDYYDASNWVACRVYQEAK